MSMTKLGLVSLLALSACGFEVTGDEPLPSRHGPDAARMDHASARHVIWNPGPGDPRAYDANWRAKPPNAVKPSKQPPGPPPGTGAGIDASATKKTLVLFDQGGPWGALGELYAMGAANLASHFGPWTAKAATAYTCGELANFDAAVYIGSTYDEPLPTCLLADVHAGTKPVIWSFYNLWELTNYVGYDAFTSAYGFNWTSLDPSSFGEVYYKGHTLARYEANLSGLLATTIVDASKATVVATARRADGLVLPWAVRSGNLTYVADIPFSYMTEEDRYLVFADLLFDALAPATPERHRVVVRIEDISPVDDPAQLRAVADYLYSQGVPFGFSVISEYRDPLGYYNEGTAETVRLEQAPELIAALKYMSQHGGVMLAHGYTHQYSNEPNPYTAVTGDDTEFYRVIENEDHTLTYVGPLPNDSVRAANNRFTNAARNFQRAKLTMPALFEFPHYAASVNSYSAAAQTFNTRWERALYFPGLLTGAKPSYTTMFGQLYPYVVRDIYGSRVLPENLGNIEPEPFYIYPTRFPEDIVNAAEKNLVIRDGVAGFYFHPFFDLQYLRDTVQGVRSLGYEFVSPANL